MKAGSELLDIIFMKVNPFYFFDRFSRKSNRKKRIGRKNLNPAFSLSLVRGEK